MTDIELSNLSAKKLRVMLEAAQLVKASCRALEKAGLNLVGECLKGQGEFYEFSHYPTDDVYDADSKSQYYFHTHRGLSGEYGHFHTFLRADGMPAMAKPIPNTGKEAWPSGGDALSHLICISMNQEGYPIGLFTTNRWVTGETWYEAASVIEMLDYFSIEHARPNLAVNHWISAMFSLYSLEMIELIKSRDLKVKEWRVAHPGKDVFEDRKLEITSHKKIDVDQKINEIKQALNKA
jgi:hypothetical protein